jgi:hypothetical protein
MTQQELIAFLEEQGFKNLRVIDGKLCGTHDYITTRGLAVGLSEISYERRYCYQNRAEADAAFAAYTDTNQHPSGMWIKVKGVFRGKPIDALNPRWPDAKPWDEVAPE